ATISSEPGKGTRIELIVPLSLSTASVVEVVTDGVAVLMPLDAVRAVSRVSPGAIVSAPRGEAWLHEGALIPALRLGAALGWGGGASERAEGTSLVALVVELGSERCAVIADAIHAISEVVVRPVPWAAGATLGVAGATVDVDGAVRLVLDPRGLFAILESHAGVAPVSATPQRRRRFLPILVIDDSLTTRMLEQSILETAGFEVDVATSAEEGLGMARARDYGLFVVDVEMPGMNGFEFTALTRDDAKLAQTNVVLVTSLAADSDRQRGKDAGASAYVVKGQFDQDDFLHQVRSLSRVEA
ncbi:MAG TPA: response regulator, partial [Polyangiaceae bacterium]|nr:response regulator [Polyangiaceae bacterium]